jgi:hypothetical protein
MPADRKPTLAALRCPIEQHVGDRVAALPTRAEAGKGRIPNDFAGLERSDLS